MSTGSESRLPLQSSTFARGQKAGHFLESALETVVSTLVKSFLPQVREFGPSLAVLSSFQREDVIVTDLVLKVAPGTRVLTLDTARVPPSTNKIIAEIESRYSITVERIVPDPPRG